MVWKRAAIILAPWPFLPLLLACLRSTWGRMSHHLRDLVSSCSVAASWIRRSTLDTALTHFSLCTSGTFLVALKPARVHSRH